MTFLGQNFKKKDLAHVIPRIIIVIVIGQTLPFKYSGQPESVWIFEQVGWESWGRYLIAIIETISVTLLLTKLYIAGAIISLSIISAANFLHFTRLGFEINGDGGLLFVLSIVVIICSLVILIVWNNSLNERLANFDFNIDLDEEEDEV